MHRFFVNIDQIADDKITLDGDDFKHITKVLRIDENEAFEVCDGMGMDYIVKIDNVQKDHLQASIEETRMSKGENNEIEITLFQGITKGSKMDEIVKHTVEAGVLTIVPFVSKRTVSKLSDIKEKKIERWQRIAYEAAKQSKRGVVPVVANPEKLSAIANTLDNYDLVLIAYEKEQEISLKDMLLKLEFDPEKIALIIGSEGGLELEEAKMLEEACGRSISLGNRILRSETAGVYAIAQLNFFYESSKDFHGG